MIAQTYLPHQFVDPRKLNLVRMNPYEMANQQAQMQQMFLRQAQMQQRAPMMLANQAGLQHQASAQQANAQQRRAQKAKPVKRVIAVNLPEDLQTIESVTSTFYPYGEILLARVLRPNKPLPFDLKQFQSKIPDLGRSVCAIIEFESAQAAKFAVDTLKFRTQELKFRLALLETGAEEELYGAHAQPQKPLMKAGASVLESAESGIELSASAQSASDRDSSTGSPKPRYSSDSDDAELYNKTAALSLTENWNVGVKEFVPSFAPKPQTANLTKPKVEPKNGRVVTSVQISLSKPTSTRNVANKIQLTTQSSKKQITYTREFLLSLRATNQKAPKMMNLDNESGFKRYSEEPAVFKPRKVSINSAQPIMLSPQRPVRQFRR